MPYKTGSWGIQAQKRNRKRFSESIGVKGEKEIEIVLEVEKRPLGFGCDYVWKGKLIDIKTSLPSKKNKYGHQYWKFNLYKQKGKIDFFLCICKNEDKTTEYVFLIPDKDLFKKNLTIPIKKVKKYFKYLLKK